MDLSTGQPADLNNHSSSGPANATHDNSKTHDSSNLGAQPTCWIRQIGSSCTDQQIDAMLQGQGAVLNGVWYEAEKDYKAPSTTIQAGSPGSPVNVSIPTASGKSSDPKDGTSVVGVVGAEQGEKPTGVYVATSTPKSGARRGSESGRGYGVVMMGFCALITAIVGWTLI